MHVAIYLLIFYSRFTPKVKIAFLFHDCLQPVAKLIVESIVGIDYWHMTSSILSTRVFMEM